MCKFCWNKHFFILLFITLVTYAQEQKRLAILRTVDDGDPSVELTDLNYLTVRLREIAGNVLQNRYGIMTEQSIIDKLGKDNATKACKEAEGCLAKLGRKINADYIGQARLGRFGGNLTISVELYNSATGLQVSTTISGEAKNVPDLLEVLNAKAPGMFSKLPGISNGKASPPAVAGGISGIQTAGGDYELNEKRYLINLSTEPSGAVLSFNGVPSTSCTQTPCKLELAEGNVRIVAVLEQYERADTTVFIKQNNQNIIIKLKPNFGFLEIKPAYLDGIGKDEQWSLAINGKLASSWENKLSPNKYKVELSHKCYEALSFEAGINKGKHEVFYMAGRIMLKKGGLALSAEQDGEPVSEPVFVNGKQVGETPFSGAVPLCAKVEIGKNRETVDVQLKHNEKVRYTYKVHKGKILEDGLEDSRDGKKYRAVVIGTQTWMAENLNYNASGSKCYDNDLANCGKFGRLYNWNTAMKACPTGWHLPSKAEWDVLMNAVGGEKTAGKYLKATSGWNDYYGQSGNGIDTYSFSALPGGRGYGSFDNVGDYGFWWSASKVNSSDAYSQYIYHYEGAYYITYGKSYLFSVRCVQGSPSATQAKELARIEALEAEKQARREALKEERRKQAEEQARKEAVEAEKLEKARIKELEAERRRQANKSYSSNSYKSNYNIKRIERTDFFEIGWQYIWDMHHIRFAGDWAYGTLGLSSSKDVEKDLYSEEEYDVEWIAGIIPRWIWKDDNSITFGFGLFGGLGARHLSEETIMRHELGIEFILGCFSLYITERNFYRVGGGVGLIF